MQRLLDGEAFAQELDVMASDLYARGDPTRRALVDLARSGVLGDPTRLDFNVSEVGDDLAVVIVRNRLIHEQITRA